MLSFKFMVLLLSFIAAGIHESTHAESIDGKSNTAVDIKNRENRTVIELNKGITVNTGLNLDIALAQLNVTEASNVPKSRGVTLVDNDSLEMKSKSEENTKEIKSTNRTTMAKPLKQVNKVIQSEAGPVDMKPSSKNDTENTVGTLKAEENKATTVTDQEGVNKAATNLTDNTKFPKNNTSITPSLTAKKPALAASAIAITTAATKPTVSQASKGDRKDIPSNVTTSSSPNGIGNGSITTSTATTTTTTTTTTTPKPKKPTITYSILDYPDLEKDNPDLKNLLQSSVSNKLPALDGPHVQPSQEFNGNFHRGRDFILPIVSMIFIIPLVIGIMITSYRRFRDCWSTRHYRRMDFLVDGMYND